MCRAIKILAVVLCLTAALSSILLAAGSEVSADSSFIAHSEALETVTSSH